jgi:hypothetical protein
MPSTVDAILELDATEVARRLALERAAGRAAATAADPAIVTVPA